MPEMGMEKWRKRDGMWGNKGEKEGQIGKKKRVWCGLGGVFGLEMRLEDVGWRQTEEN